MAATRVSIESLTGEQVGSLAPTTTVQEAKVLLGLGAGTMFFSDATQEVTGTFEGLDRAVVIPKEAPEKPVTPVELDAFAVKQQTDEGAHGDRVGHGCHYRSHRGAQQGHHRAWRRQKTAAHLLLSIQSHRRLDSFTALTSGVCGKTATMCALAARRRNNKRLTTHARARRPYTLSPRAAATPATVRAVLWRHAKSFAFRHGLNFKMTPAHDRSTQYS